MKKVIFLTVLIIIYAQTLGQKISLTKFGDKVFLCIDGEVFQGGRSQLLTIDPHPFLQPDDSSLYVARVTDKMRDYFLFVIRDTNNFWSEYCRLIYLEDTYVDIIVFDQKKIVLGLSNKNTKYNYWINKNKNWSTTLR